MCSRYRVVFLSCFPPSFCSSVILHVSSLPCSYTFTGLSLLEMKFCRNLSATVSVVLIGFVNRFSYNQFQDTCIVCTTHLRIPYQQTSSSYVFATFAVLCWTNLPEIDEVNRANDTVVSLKIRCSNFVNK